MASRTWAWATLLLQHEADAKRRRYKQGRQFRPNKATALFNIAWLHDPKRYGKRLTNAQGNSAARVSGSTQRVGFHSIVRSLRQKRCSKSDRDPPKTDRFRTFNIGMSYWKCGFEWSMEQYAYCRASIRHARQDSLYINRRS